MIYIGIGSNLASEIYGPPLEVCRAALVCLETYGDVVAVSPWYESAPVPVSDQPWFVNGVAACESTLSPGDLLSALHVVEESFGRVRHRRNEARILDLDLLAHGTIVAPDPAPSGTDTSVVPHPRMHQRAFVLLPLRDIAPDWIHPVTGQAISELIERLPPDQITRRLAIPPDSPTPARNKATGV